MVLARGPVPDALCGEKRHEGEHLVRALELLGSETALGQLRFQGELCHPPPDVGELAILVKCPKEEEELQCLQEEEPVGGLHVVEVDHVINAEGLIDPTDSMVSIIIPSLKLRIRIFWVAERVQREKWI